VGVAFDVDDFVANCCEAVRDSSPMLALRDVVQRAIADPDAIERSVGHLVDDTLGLLHRSDALTIQHGVFPPGFATGIHDHTVPAIIGTWAGAEDNRFFRPEDGRLIASGGKRCEPGEVLLLGADVVHEVRVPSGRWTAGFHVYLGDLRAIERHQWASLASPAARYVGEAFVRRWLPAIEEAGLRV
jgi:predicted metal-dependent enzyme (double-stranded beta helix superfamily)